MADSNTTLLDLLLMETNSHENDWGEILNDNFELIDAAFGSTSHATTGGTTSLTQAEAGPMMHVVTGALISNATITIPADITKPTLWKNETTGAYTLTIKTPSGTGIVLSQGDSKWLRSDGANIGDAGIPTYSQIAGVASWVGTITDTNSYIAADNGFIETLSDGLQIAGFIQNANTSTALTLDYNDTGGRSIVFDDGTAPAIGDIPASSLKSFTYKLSTNQWYMSAPSPSVIARLAANNTWAGEQTFQKGILEPPTSLTDAATIDWDMNTTSRNVTVTLGGNRTFGAPTNVNVGQWGSIEVVQDGAGSRTLAFHANFDPMGTPLVDRTISSRTVFGYYARAETAIMIWPLYKSACNSIGFYKEYNLGSLSLGGTATQAHGLGQLPALVQAYLVCTTTDVSFSAGDRIVVSGVKDADNDRGIVIYMNTTNVAARVGSTAPYLLTGAGSNSALTPSRWDLYIRVYE